MIPKNEIDELKTRIQISEVVGDYLTLKKSGANMTCCCPFHHEKSPSFIVNDTHNRYKCFGCGDSGDAFDFLQKHQGVTFIESVRMLAEKYRVTLHDQEVEETAEQKSQRLNSESMLIHLQYAQEFYENNLKLKEQEAIKAQEYALTRWSKEDIESEGIGYAFKKGPSLLSYAKANSLSLPILQMCGLLSQNDKGEYYDVFRGRLMMPIRDRMKHVIAYTARVIPKSTDAPNKEGKEPPKYINTCETLLYKKGNTLFGLDKAWKAAAKKDRCYCVEGAPDVLRLRFLGFPNTVACLGADWTPAQVQLLRSRCSTLCFIPDIDVVNKNEKFGTGIRKVMKSGAMAFEHHFKVLVKEIPHKDGKKMDADSYFKSEKHVEDLIEEDFILWYARKLFPAEGIKDNNEKDYAPEIAIIADIVSHINDGFELSHYVDQLNKLYPGKITWQNAIKQARVKRAEQAMKNAKNEETELLTDLGFSIENGGYYSIDFQGGHYKWSNFTMKPLFFIRYQQSAIRLYEIKNRYGHREFVELKQEDMSSLVKFRARVEALGNFIWYAREDQLIKLKDYLYRFTKTAELITTVGWQSGGFFAFGNGIYYNGQWLPVDEFGISVVRHTGEKKESETYYYIPAFSRFYAKDSRYEFERSFVHQGLGSISLHRLMQMWIAAYGDNAKIAICFLFATLFRDVVVEQTKWFPILNLFGIKDSGKSEFGHLLTHFFIIGNKALNLETSSVASIGEVVGQANNAIVHLDEFKDTVDQTKREVLKSLWDGVGRNRMSMTDMKTREATRVTGGVVVSGQEMAAQDVALFSRFIFLPFNMEAPTPERVSRFNALMEVRKLGFSHLTLELLQCRPTFEANFRTSYLEIQDEFTRKLEGLGVESRIINNWVVVVAAYDAIRNKVDLPFTIEDVKEISLRGIEKQNNLCRANHEIGVWWQIMNYLYANRTIYAGCHFRIEHLHELSINESKEPIRYAKAKHVLSIRLEMLTQMYMSHGTATGQKMLPVASLDYYLRHSPEFIGTRRSVRFDEMEDGKVLYKANKDGTMSKRKDSRTHKCICFDYDELVANYELDLE